MKQITITFLFVTLLSSCVCLKNNTNNSDRIILSESNLTLLDGRYKKRSVQLGRDSLPVGDLYWNFFQNTYSGVFGSGFDEALKGLNNKSDSDFFELKVIDKNKLLVSYIDGNNTITSKILKGKIKNGYFVFRKKYLFVPLIVTNFYKNSQFRIGLSNDNNLKGDYKEIMFGTLMCIIRRIPTHPKAKNPFNFS